MIGELEAERAQLNSRELPNQMIRLPLVMMLCCLMVLLGSDELWKVRTTLIHTSIEFLCIFIALLSFIIFWNTRKTASTETLLLGYGFLSVAIFNLLHAVYFPTLGLYPLYYVDIYARFGLLGRFALALLLLSLSYPYLLIPLRRWLPASIFVLTLALSWVIYSFPAFFPIIFSSVGITLAKSVVEIVLIGILLFTFIRIHQLEAHPTVYDRNHLLSAVILLTASELCFATYNGAASSAYFLGHLFRMVGYLYIYYGIFVSMVTFPYRQIAVQARQNTDMLNGLPIGILTINSEGKVTFANHEALHILDVTSSELIGQDMGILSSYMCDDVQTVRYLAQLGQEHKPVRNLILKIRTFQGSFLRLKLEASPLEGGDYMFQFIPAKREQELKNLQLQTRTILDSVNDMILITDRQGRIVTCNRTFENISGLQKKAIQREKLDLIFDVLRVKLVNPLPDREDMPSIEGRLISVRDNEEKVVLIHTAPVLNVDREIMGYLICAVDITSMKKEMHAQRQQEKLALLGQMAAGIVHEIKNPLTTIKGFSQILKKELVNRHEVCEYAQIIEETTDDLNRVIMDFLSFARPRVPVFQRVWLNDLLNSVRSMLDSHLFMNGIEISYRMSSQDMAVYIDSGQFKQVIFNLVKNAVDAVQSCPKPMVEIETLYLEDQNAAILKITDNGIGMNKEELECLGTPFFTTKDTGTGLGLSICYQIINEHNGRLEVKSQPGRGTEFNIWLPCNACRESAWSMSG